jgi:hypothetical protein
MFLLQYTFYPIKLFLIVKKENIREIRLSDNKYYESIIL